MRAIQHPLSPWLYFRRNPGRTLPITFVIVVAVALVASIVSLVDSIDLTVLTMYGYQRSLAVVTPRNALELSPDVARKIRGLPGVAASYTMMPAFTVVKTIFGKMPYVVFGTSPAARSTILDRCGLRVTSGRLPLEGKPEVALHVDIARNLRLRIGDVVLRPDSEDSYASVPVRMVGTLSGPVWLAVTSEAFIQQHYPVAPRGIIVMAQSQQAQRSLDRVLSRAVDKSRARLWTYATLVRETREALSFLYLVMGIVIGIVVFAIAFLTGMLASIYYTQRLPEFATLAAIGYQRGALIRRVLGETVILCVAGWALGSLLTIALLFGVRAWVMEPRGMLLDPFDLAAYRFTLPLPIAIAGFAVLATGRRLSRLDPVSIIERRQ